MAVRAKIRKGDTAEVISGRTEDRGRRGEVIKVLPKTNRIVIQGVNIRKKHQRQIQKQGRTLNPGIIEFEAALHISNVMVVCPKCDKPSRVGIERDEDGKPHRVCKSCDEQID
jgi:large subunit ribosomal protein L24